MSVQVCWATLLDKLALRHLLELYQYDLSEIEGTDVDVSGLFGYKYLDHYWTEAGRHPFLIKVNGYLGGFVLVNQHSFLYQETGAMSIAEFFVMKKYRKQGVGERVAVEIFEMFPGKWEVRQLAAHVGAQAFWRKVIDRYTDGQFQEILLQDERWCGPVQVFEGKNKLLGDEKIETC